LLSVINIIQGYYNLKSLVLFTKCTNLCNNIEIYLRNNFPIIIKYEVGDLGELKLCLAPKCDDSEY
jgi:proliferating cell nuclear antigen